MENAFRPAVEISSIVMNGVRTISERHCRSDAILSQFVSLRIVLYGYSPSPKELHSHPGQHLKLGVRRACSDNRHLQITGRIVIIQHSENSERPHRSAARKLTELRINKRFQQNTNNVRILSVRYSGLRSSGISNCSFRLSDRMIVIRGLLSVHFVALLRPAAGIASLLL